MTDYSIARLILLSLCVLIWGPMVYALYKKRRHFLQEAGRLTDPHEVESLNRYIRSLRTHLVIYFLFTPVTIWGLLLVLRILLPDDGEQPAIPASAPYFLVMLLIAVVLVAAKRSYRSNQKKLGTALAVDNRPPVLFLRSFRMDKQKKKTGSLLSISKSSYKKDTASTWDRSSRKGRAYFLMPSGKPIARMITLTYRHSGRRIILVV